MQQKISESKKYTALYQVIFSPLQFIESTDQRRRIQMIILLAGFHLGLISLSGIQFLAIGELPFPILMQFMLNSLILILIYAHFFKASVWLLVSTYVISNLVALFFSDLTNLMYSVTAFVAVSVLLHQRSRMLYALVMISLILGLGYLTADMPGYAVVTHENVVMFAVLGIISVMISTSVIDGDQMQIRSQIKALQAGEERYRLLAENITDMVTLHTPDGRFLYISPSYLHATGYTEAELLAMPADRLHLLVHPEDLQRTRDEAHEQALRGQTITRLQYRRKKKDGTYFWVEAHTTPIRNETGCIVQLLASSRDISEHKKLEEALFQTNERFRTVLKGSPIIVALSDRNLRYTWMHNTHPDFEIAEVLGKRDDEVARNSGTQQLAQLKQMVITTEQTNQAEITFPLSNGDITYSIVAEPLRGTKNEVTGVTTVAFDITKYKQMEAALRRKENQLGEAQRIVHLGSWHWDVRENVISWSDELYRIFGIQPEVFPGTYETYLNLIHPDDREAVTARLEVVFQNHQPYDFYHRIMNPQKGERIIHALGQVDADVNGQVVAMYGTAQDVTELKRAQEALAFRNQYLTTLHQITLDLLNRREIADLLQTLVDKASAILDAPYGEIMLKENDDLVVRAFTANQPFLEGDRITKAEGLLSWQAHDTLKPIVLEDYTRWAGKRHIYESLHLRAVADFPITIAEKCIGVLGLSRSQENMPFTDEQIQIGSMFSQLAALIVDNANQYNAALQEIVERKRIEDSLRQSEQRARALLDAIPDLVFRMTADGTFVDFKADQADLYVPAEQIVGRSMYDLKMPSGLIKQTLTAIQRALTEHRIQTLEYQMAIPERHLQDYEARLMASGKDETTIIIRNVTERKAAEKRQEQLNKELQIANQELQDFAYIISHDLKAPLRGINAITSWLVTDYSEHFDDNGRQMLNLLNNRVYRMEAMINGVLEYSRLGRRDSTIPVDLNMLVADLITDIAPGEHCSVTIDTPLPTINAEPIRIRQVFQNLIDNALKYMDKPQGEIHIACQQRDSDWLFTVSDNGPGIEARHFNKIFQIFQTLNPRDEVESTGMGLAIVKRIIESYGSTIWLESTVGQGSIFFFTLPLK